MFYDKWITWICNCVHIVTRLCSAQAQFLFLLFFRSADVSNSRVSNRIWFSLAVLGLTCGLEDFARLSWLGEQRATHLGPWCLSDYFQHFHKERNHQVKCLFCVTVSNGADHRLFRAVASRVYVFLLQLLCKNNYGTLFPRKHNINYLYL